MANPLMQAAQKPTMPVEPDEDDQPKKGKSVPVSELFATLLHAATQGHMLHLQTKSFAAHMALDEFYKSMPGLVDDLIEAWQGCNAVIGSYPSGFSPQTDPVAFMQSLSSYLESNRDAIGDETELQNMADEIAGLIDTTLYKLRNLK
jgi:hypothetical protein